MFNQNYVSKVDNNVVPSIYSSNLKKNLRAFIELSKGKRSEYLGEIRKLEIADMESKLQSAEAFTDYYDTKGKIYPPENVTMHQRNIDLAKSELLDTKLTMGIDDALEYGVGEDLAYLSRCKRNGMQPDSKMYKELRQKSQLAELEIDSLSLSIDLNKDLQTLNLDKFEEKLSAEERNQLEQRIIDTYFEKMQIEAQREVKAGHLSQEQYQSRLAELEAMKGTTIFAQVAHSAQSIIQKEADDAYAEFQEMEEFKDEMAELDVEKESTEDLIAQANAVLQAKAQEQQNMQSSNTSSRTR